jgi:hypothetical protein
MLDSLELYLSALKSLRRKIKVQLVDRVSKVALRREAGDLGTQWHESFSPTRSNVVDSEVKEKYDKLFRELIRLSSPNNLKTSYLNVLNPAISSFNDDLVLPMKTGSLKAKPVGQYDAFFRAIGAGFESEYLTEAIACARENHFRAAAVLGWSAAIDRIHRKLGEDGYKEFNRASAWMAAQQSGRFKKFNQTQNIQALSQIREIFDTTVLWIVEGMQLIDSNQHTRLKSCFDIRCQSAHPGDAKITAFNLLSFFSDLDQIIYNNSKFQLEDAGLGLS